MLLRIVFKAFQELASKNTFFLEKSKPNKLYLTQSTLSRILLDPLNNQSTNIIRPSSSPRVDNQHAKWTMEFGLICVDHPGLIKL